MAVDWLQPSKWCYISNKNHKTTKSIWVQGIMWSSNNWNRMISNRDMTNVLLFVIFERSKQGYLCWESFGAIRDRACLCSQCGSLWTILLYVFTKCFCSWVFFGYIVWSEVLSTFLCLYLYITICNKFWQKMFFLFSQKNINFHKIF